MDVWPLPRVSFRELASVEETRPVALITNQIAWSVVSKKIELPLVIQAEPNRNDRDFFEYLAANLPSSVQVVYAVGEDLQIDAAKFVASESKKPLVIIPTALSSDTAFTPLVTVWDKNQPTSFPLAPPKKWCWIWRCSRTARSIIVPPPSPKCCLS